MDSPFLGMMQYWAMDWAPKGYALCNGALLSIAQNAALFSLFGTYYGGDGRTTFGLPDLRGRSVVGQSNSHVMGEKFGSPTATLLSINMPSHSHTVPAVQIPAFSNPGRGGSTDDPTGAYPSSPNAGTMYSATPGSNVFLGAPSVAVGFTGSNLPISIQNPYLAVTASVSTIGIFPSRN